MAPLETDGMRLSPILYSLTQHRIKLAGVVSGGSKIKISGCRNPSFGNRFTAVFAGKKRLRATAQPPPSFYGIYVVLVVIFW